MIPFESKLPLSTPYMVVLSKSILKFVQFCIVSVHPSFVVESIELGHDRIEFCMKIFLSLQLTIFTAGLEGVTTQAL